MSLIYQRVTAYIYHNNDILPVKNNYMTKYWNRLRKFNMEVLVVGIFSSVLSLSFLTETIPPHRSNTFLSISFPPCHPTWLVLERLDHTPRTISEAVAEQNFMCVQLDDNVCSVNNNSFQIVSYFCIVIKILVSQTQCCICLMWHCIYPDLNLLCWWDHLLWVQDPLLQVWDILLWVQDPLSLVYESHLLVRNPL